MSQFIEMIKNTTSQRKKIHEIAKVQTGSTPSKNRQEYWYNGNHPWVSAQDMIDKYVEDTIEKVTNAGYATCKVIPAGSVLYVCRGSIGVISINKMDCATNQSICTATCLNNCRNEFLYYSLKYSEKDIKQQGTGTSFKSLNQSSFSSIEIDVPSLDKQNTFIEIAQQADKSKFIGFKSQFIEMFGNPVANNRNWPTLPIAKVAPEKSSKNRQSGKVWILNLDMIESDTGKVINKIYDNDTNLVSVAPFDEGNILFSKLRPYLNKVVIPNDKGYATTELVPLRPDISKLNLIFLSNLLRSDSFVNYANSISSGTKMPRMPLTDLRKFECILPPITMQKEFAAIVEQADKSKYIN